jgi:hypothetical protein
MIATATSDSLKKAKVPAMSNKYLPAIAGALKRYA